MECYPNGRNAARAVACVERNITSYPTWMINGQWQTGVIPPDRLAQLSGYLAPALPVPPKQP